MRRIAALLAAGVLALAIASPAAAAPLQNPGNHEYWTDCPKMEPFLANASHSPGWNDLWVRPDVPWVLMAGTIVSPDGEYSFAKGLGLAGKEKLVGPCTITPNGDHNWYIRDAYLLVPVSGE